MSKVLPHSPILIKNSNTLQYDRDLSYSHHCPYLPRHPSSLAPQPSLSHVSLTNEMKVGKSSHQTHNFNQTCRRHIQHFINFKPPPPPRFLMVWARAVDQIFFIITVLLFPPLQVYSQSALTTSCQDQDRDGGCCGRNDKWVSMMIDLIRLHFDLFDCF